MNYKIEISEKIEKTLKKIPEYGKILIIEKINKLAQEPRPPLCSKMEGMSNVYRIRAGNYRILYSIDDEIITIIVLKIGHRQNVYK